MGRPIPLLKSFYKKYHFRGMLFFCENTIPGKAFCNPHSLSLLKYH